MGRMGRVGREAACSALQTQGWLLLIAPREELIDITLREWLKHHQILNKYELIHPVSRGGAFCAKSSPALHSRALMKFGKHVG